MINFNSKYFTLLAVAFLMFVVYQNNKSSAGRSLFAPTTYVPIPGKEPTFTYKIDPSDGGNNLSLIDKAILKIIDKELPPKEAISPHTQPQQTNDSNRVIKEGDWVKIIYKPYDAKEAEPDPINIVVGYHQIPQQAEKGLIGLKVGEVKIVEIDKEHNNYTRLEVLAINNGNPIPDVLINNNSGKKGDK